MASDRRGRLELGSTRIAVAAAAVSVLGALASLGPAIWKAHRDAELVSRASSVPSRGARIRVMCLGDSITDFGYPHELALLMGPGYRVSNEGVSGETTGQMLGRWRLGLLPARPDILVVLGGVNDLQLGSGLAAPITANLGTIYSEARQAGVQVVAVTILPFEGAAGWSPEIERERALVNAFILGRCASTTGMACVDAETAMKGPGGRLAGGLDAGDHLHLGPEGRRRLAALVAEALRSLEAGAR